MKSQIWVTTQVVGYHAWPLAPNDVKFLRDQHRHVFHIKVGMNVSESRQLEFFQEKRRLHTYMDAIFLPRSDEEIRFGSKSCEEIASEILDFDSNYDWVEVSEDGENGAIVRR